MGVNVAAATEVSRRVPSAGLHDALVRGELSLRYQPVLGLVSDRVVGVEALLRWRPSGADPVAPDAFIPVAEASGEIVPVGAWVLEQACRQWVRWQRQSATGVPRMAVNVSVRQLGQPDLVATVRNVLHRTRMPPGALCLEITESALGDDHAGLVACLDELDALGVRLSIDDFGTGFSSFARLRDFPVDELKIDRSFVANMAADGRDRAIVQSMVALGSALDLAVVAEGVETSEQLAILRTIGCGAAQGYIVSPPARAGAIPARVRALRSAAGGDQTVRRSEAPVLADGTSGSEVSFLLSLAVGVMASTDLGSALAGVLRPVCERLGWDCGQAWTPRLGELSCASEWYGDVDELSAFRTASVAATFRPGAGLPGRAFEQRRAVWSDLATDENFPRFEAARSSGLRTGVAAPVIADGEVVAVVEFYARHVRPRSSRTIDVLSSIVGNLGSSFERRQARAALDGVRARLDGIVQVTDDAVVVADGQGRVVEWNPAAERLFGWARHEMIGEPLSVIVPSEHRRAHVEGVARAAAAGHLTMGGRPIELVALRRDGSRFPIELTLSQLPTEQAPAFVGLVRDITARKAAEHELERHVARLEDFIGLLHLLLEPDSTLGTAMTAIAEGTAELCDADGAVIELRDGDEMVFAGVAGIAAAHAGLRLPVRASLSGHCATTGRLERCDDTEIDDRVDRDICRAVGVRSMLVVPFAHRGSVFGVLEVVSARPSAFRDGDSAVLELVAGVLGAAVAQARAADELMRSAVEREQAAAALRAAEQRFRMLFEHAPIAMALTSLGEANRGELIDVNQAMADLLGRRRDALVGRDLSSITAPDETDIEPGAFGDIRGDAELAVVERERHYLHADGHAIACHAVATVVRDARGHPLYTMTQIRDVRADLEEKRRLAHEALHDPLTGLPNRRMLDDRLGVMLGEARRGGQAVSVFMIDLDGLKAVNDRFGHDVGDAAIVAAGRALARCLRAHDHVARVGGDEFVAVVAGDGAVGPEALAVRFADAVAISSPRSCAVALTASVGWAVDDGLASPGALVHNADACMYETKRAKRADRLAPPPGR